MQPMQLIALTKNLTDEQKALFTELYDKRKKSTAIAYILLICFGGVGAHKFYLNNSKGWLYLAFCWTSVPAILAFIQAFTLNKTIDAYNQNIATQIINLIKTYDDIEVARITIPTLIKASSPVGIIAGCVLVFFILMIFASVNKRSIEHEYNSDDNNITHTTHQDLSNNTENTEQTKQKAKSKTPQLVVSARALYKEFEANEAMADSKYSGQLIQVTGNISDIHKEIHGVYSVSLSTGDDYGLSNVICELEPHDLVLKSLSKGQQVSIVGYLDGNGLTANDVNFKDGCQVIAN